MPTESPTVSPAPTLSPEEIEAALDPDNPAYNKLIIFEPSESEVHEFQKDKKLTFTLTKKVLKPAEEIHYFITNSTKHELRFGDDFTLEKSVDGVWHRAGYKMMMFNSIGYMVSTGGSFEGVIPLTRELPAGTYRLVKEVSLEDAPKQEKIALISGDFQIE
ncbi:immunoglobulin-like domain-containing protein [Paenibacillus harenae]|uniref:immunoglobulin-like domain-containing protein n=1 Tax=Paenibacillus harenae TaxID=306543 RepID=UPI002793E6DD|nr:immunoglobulin-like domain-containing protein [Paenibacillus harenae]MDQ0062290.1 hypothetical protein [Paenibacillus harenae]